MIKLSNYGFNILQLETYGLCNMECGFCPYPLKNEIKKKTKLTEDKIYEIIDQIDPSDQNFQYITFSHFNEPLLDNKIFDYVRYAKKKNIEVHFITNGLLLDKDNIINNFLDTKPILKISLQILDSSKHVEGRGLKLEFERYFKKILIFIDKVRNSDLNVTIDIGSNFQNNGFLFNLKKLLGLDIGDPNIPYTTNETLELLDKYFIKDSETLSKNIIKTDKYAYKSYLNNDGFKISKNITLKIKPFMYGRRIKNFYPINDNFSCDSKILAIQSTGDVVPCCLAYDDKISMGNILEKGLSEILNNGQSFLYSLRTKGEKKHDICRKCFGEPTKRGAHLRNLINSIR